jgi:hypothetical protein
LSIGDFSFDPLSLAKMSKDMERYKVSELKNGRLAMLAFSGIVTQAALYDKGFPCKSPPCLYDTSLLVW